jgi:hypothetical protein
MGVRGKQFLAVALLAVLLGGGVALGVVIDRTWLRPEAREGDRTQRLLARFRDKLGLDAEQERAVGQALRRGRAELDAIRARIEPELTAARKRMRAEVSRVLRPDQRARYEEMVARYEAKRASRR